MSWVDVSICAGAFFIAGIAFGFLPDFKNPYASGMSARELRVRLDQIHQSLHLAILHNRKLIMTAQQTIDGIAASLSTVSDSLTETGATLAKADTEIVAEIQALKDQIANGQVVDFTALESKAAGLTTIATALSAAAKALDDLNQDPAAPVAP